MIIDIINSTKSIYLYSEFDEDERPSIEVKGKVTSIDGRILLEEVNELLNLSIEDEEVDSIGGWLFKKLEGAPAKGRKVTIGKHEFEVAEVDRLRIVRVHITVSEAVNTPS